MKRLSLCFCLLFLITSYAVTGQSQILTDKEKALFTPPKMYMALYSDHKLTIDGKLSEKAWQQAAWSENFVDIEGDAKPKPSFNTSIKMLWGDSCLYIAARLQEPHLWATLRRHDTVIYNDNDFEVFIDPFNTTQPYFEIEVNAFNTIFDLLLPKPYRNRGSAMIGYNVAGLQSAVDLNGTINNPTDTDSGWTVEMAVPFSAITLGNEVHVPMNGEQWRINFSRVEWDMEVKNGIYLKKKDGKGRNLPEHNWVWSPQGVVSMHYPERWGYVQCSKNDTTAITRPVDEEVRNLLWLVYYRQKAWQETHGSYTNSLADLNIINTQLQLEATRNQFLCTIRWADHMLYSINQDGFIVVNSIGRK